MFFKRKENGGKMIYETLGKELKEFGGYLKCMECGRESEVGNIANHLQFGWQKCCNYTMRWITKNEIMKGKVLA